MAKKISRRQQQEQMREILQGDYSHAGRPRRRVHHTGRPQPPPNAPAAPPPQNVFDFPQQQAPPRQVRQAPPAPRPAAQPVRAAARTGHAAGGWVLIAVLLVVLVAAGTGLFLVLTGRVNLGGGAQAQPQVAQGNPVLAETGDAGARYVQQTLFIGDSNTVRLGQFGLVETGRLAAQESVGIEAVGENAFLVVGGYDSPLTAAQAAGAIQPARILVMLGTNNASGLSVEDFAARYAAAIDALQREAPDAALVLAGIPPVAQATAYAITNETIAQFNQAIRDVCAARGLPYLDTTGALAGQDGALLPEYAEADGVHLTQAGLEAFLQYYRTHAWNR